MARAFVRPKITSSPTRASRKPFNELISAATGCGLGKLMQGSMIDRRFLRSGGGVVYFGRGRVFQKPTSEALFGARAPARLASREKISSILECSTLFERIFFQKLRASGSREQVGTAAHPSNRLLRAQRDRCKFRGLDFFGNTMI